MVASAHIFIPLLYILRDITSIRCEDWIRNPEVDRHLQMGRELLTQGMYDDALTHYHAAVEADPFNYLTYYTRATVYLAIGKVSSALKDLTKVIDLKPDFTAARLQRGNVYLKQGRLDEAHIDFEFVLRIDPSNPDANHGYTVIEPMKRDIEFAYSMFADHNHVDAINLLTDLLQTLPWDVKLRDMRSQCYEKIGDIMSAASDLRSIVKSQSDNQMQYLRLSELYYLVGDTQASLDTIRECLRYDPDHKGCFTYYKFVKKIAAHFKALEEFYSEKNYAECVQRVEKALPLENKVPKIMFMLREKHCKCLNKVGNPTEAIKACRSALDVDPKSEDILCEIGDAYIELQDYSAAIDEFHKASNLNEHSERAQEGLKKAQRLEKGSKVRDYYAILDVPRRAQKKEILKAYRKMAQKWHPDNFQEGEEKARAEKKFIDIAAAKEVLTDPEKREKFDNGHDPLDPESQQQGHHPFHQHFHHPFGDHGGPSFTYKFHFS